MQHGIGASSHGYVERHGIEESLPRGDALWQHALVAILIVCVGVLDNLPCGGLEEFYAVLMGSKNCTVARQRQADGLCERVHGVGSEHTRAAAAAWAGASLYLCQLLIADIVVGTLNHCRYKVGILATPSSCLHRSSRTEHCRDIESH